MTPTIPQLTAALAAAWSPATIYPQLRFDAANPARGQCVVSSLVVQHFLGGELQRYHVTGAGYDEKHYANLLPDGTLLDTTFRQYQGAAVTLTPLPPKLAGYPTERARHLADKETRERYEVLLAAVNSLSNSL